MYSSYSSVGAGTNKQIGTTKNTAKLDRETEELKHDKVPLDLGKYIMQGRQAKGWNQKDLSTVSSFVDKMKLNGISNCSHLSNYLQKTQYKCESGN